MTKSAFANGHYIIEFELGTATLSATSANQLTPGDTVSFHIEPQQVRAVDG